MLCFKTTFFILLFLLHSHFGWCFFFSHLFVLRAFFTRHTHCHMCFELQFHFQFVYIYVCVNVLLSSCHCDWAPEFKSISFVTAVSEMMFALFKLNTYIENRAIANMNRYWIPRIFISSVYIIFSNMQTKWVSPCIQFQFNLHFNNVAC